MRATCRRIGDGQAIRDAMRERQLNLTDLAARTKELDSDGRGVSYQLIGFLTAKGRSRRSTVSPKSAGLIALALGKQQNELFESSYTALRRIGDGQSFRDAMTARKTDPHKLARRTRRVDPAKRGVPEDVLTQLADAGATEPVVIPQRAASLIAEALDYRENELFEPVDSRVPASSTLVRTQVSAA